MPDGYPLVRDGWYLTNQFLPRSIVFLFLPQSFFYLVLFTGYFK